MLLLQLSSAQGPDECCLAVAKTLSALLEDAKQYSIMLDVLEYEAGDKPDTYRSVLLSLQGEHASDFASHWCGTIQWTCQSPYRPNHPRKNWFIGIARFELPDLPQDNHIAFETLRSSGPGGQHVNKTESAIRATHISSGISVKVQSERSQHANKKLAVQLLAYKLQQQHEEANNNQRFIRRMFHHQIERGNPIKQFKSLDFIEK